MSSLGGPVRGQTPAPAGLEAMLAAVQARLDGLHEALLQRDAAAIERRADDLRSVLAQAAGTVTAAARTGGLPPQLRQRLAGASAQVAVQRESLARATAALDRAMNTLLPSAGRGPALYSSTGVPDHRAGGPGLDA